MLQLQAKNINICRISKLLAKYNIKASITDSIITLDGDISNELLNQLCNSIDINTVQNFTSQGPAYVPKETPIVKSEECIKTEVVEEPKEAETIIEEEAPNAETTQPPHILSQNNLVYDLLYSEVKRGEVYICDFTEPYGHEQGFIRYAIVIQNDVGNLYSPTTIVVPCTTRHKKELPTHLLCTFSSKNMIDYNRARVGSKENVIMTEHIRTIDKSRLRKYLGTLTPDFMKKIDGKIDISLHLDREVQTIVKQKKVNKPKGRKDLNMVQVQLLSLVDINELLKISHSNFTDEIKVKKILDLFGFDFKKNGVQYLLKAIIASPKNAYFNLETLSKSVSQKESVDKEEIKRLIIARVKETLSFRESPTIDFIRLVNSFLVKEEVSYEETNN